MLASLLLATLASTASAGTCPSTDSATLYTGGKTRPVLTMGDLTATFGAGGMEITGFKQGNDMVVRATAGGAEAEALDQPRGNPTASILDVGEAGDNAHGVVNHIFVANPGEGVILGILTHEYEIIYVVGPGGVGAGFVCDDGSELSIAYDGEQVWLGQSTAKGDSWTSLGLIGTAPIRPAELLDISLDGTFRQVEVSGVELGSLSVVNDAQGRRGIQVTIEDSVIDEVFIENVTRVDLDDDSIVTTLSVDAATPM